MGKKFTGKNVMWKKILREKLSCGKKVHGRNVGKINEHPYICSLQVTPS